MAYLLGWVFNFLCDIVEVVPSVIGPETVVESDGDVAQSRLATGEVGLL